MLAYSQLLKTKGAVRKQFWYICGPERALVQDALELAKDYAHSGVPEVCLGTFFAPEADLNKVIEFLEAPYFEERKLVIIHSADKITYWPELINAVQNLDPSTFMIFVGGPVPAADDPCMPLFVNNRLGRAVKCSAMKPEAVKTWVESRLCIPTPALNILLANFYGDYEWLLNKIRLLEYLNVDEITTDLIDFICRDTGVQDFEESLIEFDKRQCFLYIKHKGTEDINLNKITEDALNLSLLQTVVGQYSKQLRPVVDKTGFSMKKIEGYMDKISNYDLTSSTRAFKTITKLYPQLSRGDRSAFLSLVCGW